MNTCVVSDNECEAPAGWGISGLGYAQGTESVGKTKCYICGEPVCLKCSNLVTWYAKRVRACLNCTDSYGIEIKNKILQEA